MEDSIIIGGDFYLPERFSNISPSQLFSPEIKKIFTGTSFNIVNLEAPICEPIKDKRIVKTGPHLNCPKEVFSFLEYINVKLLSLANNHILDYGKYGVHNTIEKSKEHGIDCFGAGMTLTEASNIYYKELDNGTIAILNIAENEWACATESTPGANPFDLIDLISNIKLAKKKADFVFVIIHGGHEYYALPSPRMVKLYRFLIDEGVDAVIGHHTHFFSGFEVYKSSPIFYSLGNFVFPSLYEKPREWNEGILVKLKINTSKKVDFELFPYVQNSDDTRVRTMSEKEKSEFDQIIREKSRIISNKHLLAKEWQKYVGEMKKYYLSIYSNSNLVKNEFIEKVIKKTGIQKFFFTKKYLKNIVNAIRCESHLDISLEVLEDLLKEKTIK